MRDFCAILNECIDALTVTETQLDSERMRDVLQKRLANEPDGVRQESLASLQSHDLTKLWQTGDSGIQKRDGALRDRSTSYFEQFDVDAFARAYKGSKADIKLLNAMLQSYLNECARLNERLQMVEARANPHTRRSVQPQRDELDKPQRRVGANATPFLSTNMVGNIRSRERRTGNP